MDAFNPYRAWLGLETDKPRDYYALLGLAQFAADRDQIAAAAARATTRVRSIRPGPQAREWSRLLDEIQAARDCLTDERRKAAYDEGLRRGEWPEVVIPSLAASTAPPSALAAIQHEFYPPNGTPQSADRLATENPAQDEALALPAGALTAAAEPDALLPPEALPEALPVPAGAAESELPEALPVSWNETAAPAAIARAAQPLEVPQSASRASAPSLRKTQPRRNRRWGLGGILLGGAAIAGLGGVTYWLVSSQPAQPATTDLVQTAKADDAAQPDKQAAPTKPQAEEASTVPNAGPPSPTKTRRPKRPTTPKQSPTAAVQPEPQTAATPLPNSATASSENTAPANKEKPDSSPTLAQSASSLPLAASVEPDRPKIGRADAQALIKALEAAKAAYADQNFKAAELQIAKAESLAKWPPHQAAVARLKAAGGYVKKFRDATADAVKNMEAGSSFKVGNSTQVSFVEGLTDKVILRIAGMNRTYAFNDLPPGLAVVLADFKLPAADPESRVVKGAYLLLHKRADSETHDKAQSLWQEARAAGAKIEHLLPLLTDNYGDLLKDAAP